MLNGGIAMFDIGSGTDTRETSVVQSMIVQC